MLRSSNRSSDNKDIIVAFGVALVSILFHLIYFRYGVTNLVDLGVVCVDSERVLNGQISGRDFFDSYGPGRFYLAALSFLIGGKSLLSFSVLCLILLAVKDLIIYLTARFLLSRPWAIYIALCSIVFHGPIHKVFLPLAGIIALYSVFKFARQPSNKSAFLMGVFIVVAGLLRYDMGAAGLIIASVALILISIAGDKIERPGIFRLALTFILGVIVVAVPIAAYFYFNDADPGMMIENHLARLNSLEQAIKVSPGFSDIYRSSSPQDYLFSYMFIFFAVVTFLALLLTLILALKRKVDNKTLVFLTALLLLALMAGNQVRLGIKFSRFSQVSPYFFMLLAVLLQYGFNLFKSGSSLRHLRLVIPAIAIAVSLFVTAYIYNYQGRQSQDSFATLRYECIKLDIPRGQCYISNSKGLSIQNVIRFIEKTVPPGQAIFTGPTCPLLHFLSDRPNPLPFTDFTFYFFDIPNQKTVIRAIDEANVQCVINMRRPLTGFVFYTSAPQVYNHIKSNFYLDKRIGLFEIYRRIE